MELHLRRARVLGPLAPKGFSKGHPINITKDTFVVLITGNPKGVGSSLSETGLHTKKKVTLEFSTRLTIVCTLETSKV